VERLDNRFLNFPQTVIASRSQVPLSGTAYTLVTQIPKKRVGVYPPGELHERKLTFASLAELFPVVFESFCPETSVLPDACVFLGQHPPAVDQLDIPCYVYEKKPANLTARSSTVMFASSPCLDTSIRGHTLVESGPREISFCPVRDGDTVIATVASCPVWTVRGSVHRVSADLPTLIHNQLLYTHFVPQRWLGLLPVIHFLRSVTADIDWQAPPLMACFIIDDPNLHALTYGCVDFRRVAFDAKDRNYHVAFGMVPLDAWYVNRNAARLFKEHSDYISLAVHGSEHTRNELAESKGNQLSRLAQALRRIDVVERKAGLDVSRIMLPPHDACSEATMDLILRLGYEGMAMRASKLLYWTAGKRWRPDFGFGSVLWTGFGFPILRRFRLVSDVTGIRLAAFLGQPILPCGHHSDSSELLANVAETINSIGARWADLKSIMRANYRTKTVGDLLQIQMCSRYIKVRIPEHIKRIIVHRPWMVETDIECLVYGHVGNVPKNLFTGRVTEQIEVNPGSEIVIRALPNEQINYRILANPRIRAWPIVRRVLTETRDRLWPVACAVAGQDRIWDHDNESQVLSAS
jgi:hypothetical protein